MKRYLLFSGILALIAFYSACSSSTDLAAASDDPDETSQTTSSSSKKSSSSSKKSSSGDSVLVVDSTEIKKDTVVDKVYISANSTEHPYYSSAVAFCWDEGCEANLPSSSSKAKSSSSSSDGGATIDTPSEEPPTINGNTMTDNRDKKTYQLQNIAGKLWMAENLRYETSNGAFCSTEGGEDHCAKYGQFYTYAAAQRVCPGGWRLPTEAEVKAADAEVPHEWWSVGGRFKVADGKATEYGLEDEQGYIWTQANGELNSWRVKNYNGDDEHAMQSSEGAERAYNVRCVQE